LMREGGEIEKKKHAPEKTWRKRQRKRGGMCVVCDLGAIKRTTSKKRTRRKGEKKKKKKEGGKTKRFTLGVDWGEGGGDLVASKVGNAAREGGSLPRGGTVGKGNKEKKKKRKKFRCGLIIKKKGGGWTAKMSYGSIRGTGVVARKKGAILFRNVSAVKEN